MFASVMGAITEPSRLKGGQLVLDPARLFEFSGFTPNYLHLTETNGQNERAL